MSQSAFTFDTPRRSYTVSQLTAEIRAILEKSFGSLWVEGEVSNFSAPASGHLYFTLKDERAQIRCVMFRHQARLLLFRIADGQKLVARAHIGVYEPRGEYQLVLDYAEPLGVGALELAFRQLKEKLAAEGLFDQSRKTPVPKIPRKVGVVTSETGAAIRDIIRTVTRRSKLVDLLLVPVKVQGEGAAREIANAIRLLDSPSNPWGELDVIIIGRGGGSLEDLWAFNEEQLARAVAACSTPIISAVGHETDFVIADFVADERAATPTAAAERVSPLESEITRMLSTGRARLANALAALVKQYAQRVSSLRKLLPDPRRDIETKSQRLDDVSERFRYRFEDYLSGLKMRLSTAGRMMLRTPLMERAERKGERLERAKESLLAGFSKRLELSEAQLSGLKMRIESTNPSNVLKRGYAIVKKLPEGQIVKSYSQVAVEDKIEIILHEGKILSRVEETKR